MRAVIECNVINKHSYKVGGADYIPQRVKLAPTRRLIARTLDGVIAVKSDGSVLTAGQINSYSNLNFDTESWTNITSISSSGAFCIGLKKDGTIVYTGEPLFPEQTAVLYWTDIVDVSTSIGFCVGLRTNGTVVATEFCFDSEDGNCHFDTQELSTWRNIVEIATGESYIAGLKVDGRVVVNGYYKTDFVNEHPRYFDLSNWKNVVQISGENNSIVGLQADGKVLYAGIQFFDNNIEKLREWKDIVLLSHGMSSTLGLKSNGTVITTSGITYISNEVSHWTDVVFINEDINCAIKSDGTLLCVPSLRISDDLWICCLPDDMDNRKYQIVSKWKLF